MKAIIILSIALACLVLMQSFAPTTLLLQTTLSAYHIYEGKPTELIPAKGFIPYQVSTPLFSDYAEKQRLIYVPAGSIVQPAGNGLPTFPEGTMLVKTFYYYNDKRDTGKGKQVVETRVIIRTGSTWIAGTYAWNGEQTDATLISDGKKIPINYINERAENIQITYEIPGKKDCAKCHNANNLFMPIGFKMRNLNMDMDGVNQLAYLHQRDILAEVKPEEYAALPQWNDVTISLEQRARAYLDMNCAHCHNASGYCASANFHLNYEIPTADTRIGEKKNKLLNMMERRRMPQAGTTMLHHEGVALIKEYINSL